MGRNVVVVEGGSTNHRRGMTRLESSGWPVRFGVINTLHECHVMLTPGSSRSGRLTEHYRLAMVPLNPFSARFCYLLFFAGGVLLHAQLTPGESMRRAKSDSMFDGDVEIRGVFEGVLPQTQDKYSLKLLVHPHFGDFHRKSSLRIPVGFRYGLSDNWDIATELETYVSHGLDGIGAFEEMGLSGVHVTTKYRSSWTPLPGWEMAGRLRYTHPVDHPPVGLTDGLEHFLPTLTFARALEGIPGTELFWSTGLDLVRQTHIFGRLEDNEFGDNATSFTGGLVWQRGRRIYTFESTYATTALIGKEAQHRASVRPGVIFRVPSKYTFKSNGDWRVGVAMKFIYGPDGPDLGLSVKFRGSFDLKSRRARIRQEELTR